MISNGIHELTYGQNYIYLFDSEVSLYINSQSLSKEVERSSNRKKQKYFCKNKKLSMLESERLQKPDTLEMIWKAEVKLHK